MMKLLGILLLLATLLTGCAAAPTIETVNDVFGPQTEPEPKKLGLSLPDEAAAQIISGDSGALYLCDNYEVTQQFLPGGDIAATLQQLTGYDRSRLTVIQTETNAFTRYECAWTAAGEQGDTVGRAVVLDDGYYHYCLTVMADAEDAGELQSTWQEILRSYGSG